MMGPMAGILSPLAGGFVGGVTYLLRDEFTTSQSAPLSSPRSCEPGPGTLTLVQNTRQFSISGGQMITGTAPSNYTSGFWQSGSFTRVCGRIFAAVMSYDGGNGPLMGLYPGLPSSSITSATPGALEHRLWRRLPNDVRSQSASELAPSGALGGIGTITSAILLRDAGAYLLMKQSGIWTLIWVDNTGNSSSLYPACTSHAGAFTTSEISVFDLAELDPRFATDYGLATSSTLGAVSAGQTFTHTADFLMERTITTRPTAAQTDSRFRKQDANNYWAARVTSAGDYRLIEVVAGVETQRANAAGVVSSGHRIVIIAEGSTIRGYSNNTLRWTYSSATNFQSATSGELATLGTGGVVSDVAAYPRTVTLPEF